MAHLHPIPVINEPFERLIIDCVGLLPRSKSGHQYVLTIMCAGDSVALTIGKCYSEGASEVLFRFWPT